MGVRDPGQSRDRLRLLPFGNPRASLPAKGWYGYPLVLAVVRQ